MKIANIFQSINGEVTSAVQGSVTTFLRMQGCTARCKYCDTPASQSPYDGEQMTIDEICERVSNFQIKTKNITITGGEPLEQEKELIDLLCELTNYHITLETNGLQSLRTIASYVNCIVMDYKILPEENIMAEKNLRFLGSNDWVKIPIQNIKDFSTALKVRNLLKTEKWSPKLAFSAVAPLTSKQLLSWMFEQKVTDVILNIQLHKLIGVS